MYKFDDGTGTLEGKVWLDVQAATHDEDGNALPEDSETAQVGDWARVLATAKALNGKKYVVVNNVKKVRDKNEISYHLLEVVYVHLYLTRGAVESLQEGGSGGEEKMQGVQSGGGGYNQQNQQGQQPQNRSADGLAGLSGIAKKVYHRFQIDQANEGVHVDVVARELGLSYAQVKKAAEELSNASKIFTTVDDDTYAVLDE